MVKKVVALDVGSVRIGVAGNDALGITAQAIETWKRKGLQNDLEHMKQVAKDRMAQAFVLGLPRNMDGSEGQQASIRVSSAMRFTNTPVCPSTMWMNG